MSVAAAAVIDDVRAPAVAARPPCAPVVWDPSPEQLREVVDWSHWYLTDEEDMGQGGEQAQIIDVLTASLKALAAERRWPSVLISWDQFFGWREDEPLVRVSPDVFVLDDPPPPPYPAMWKTWLPEHRPPRLAFEIVSGDGWAKDYRDNPPKYAQLGTRELAVFDPFAATGTTSVEERVALQVFHRQADGVSVRVYHGPGPVRLDEADAWLVVEPHAEAVRLRLARDSSGQDIIATAEEALGRAEREVAELRAELARLRRES